jgi:hypothetical protein
MKKARCRIDVNLDELDRVLDGAREAPLSESDHGKLRDALHALAELLVRTRNTEKTVQWLGSRKTLKPEHSRITTRHRPLGTAVMEQRHLVVRGRLTSSTRS